MLGITQNMNKWTLPFLIFLAGFGVADAVEIQLQLQSVDSQGQGNLVVGYTLADTEPPLNSYALYLKFDPAKVELSGDIDFKSPLDGDGLGGQPLQVSRSDGLVVSASSGSLASTARSGDLFSLRFNLLEDVPTTISLETYAEQAFTGFTGQDCSALQPTLKNTNVEFDGIPKIGNVTGIVWNDLSRSGTTENANLSTLGLPNINIILFSLTDGSTIRTTTAEIPASPADPLAGTYLFENVPIGPYRVYMEDSSIPTNFVFVSTPLAVDVDVLQDATTNVNFGLSQEGTAVRLASASAQIKDMDTQFIWQTAYEDQTLGYTIQRVSPYGLQPVGEFTLAVGGGRYELLVGNSTTGIFLLNEVTTDLEETTIAVLIPGRKTPPLGQPVKTRTVTTGDSWNVPEGILSYLLEIVSVR